MAAAKATFNNALGKDVLSQEELKLFQNVAAHFPFFQQAKYSIYKHHLASENIEAEATLNKLALITYNRASLYDLKEKAAASKKELPQVQASNVATNELAIPGFKFRISGKVEEASDLDPIISDENLIEYEPTATYSLEREFDLTESSSLKSNRTAELIDGFLNKSRERKKPEVVLKARIEDDSLQVPNDLVSETLAKIYVKQEKYTEAIELYKKLILLEPDKKASFNQAISEIQLKLN
jgi:tetratricopeptide (TPR) repeat protein